MGARGLLRGETRQVEAIPDWPDGDGARNWDAFADGLGYYLLDTDHP